MGPLNSRGSSGGNTRAGPRQSRGDSGTPPLFRSCLSFLSSLSQRRSSVGPLSRASTDHVPRPPRNYARTIQNIRPGCISLAVPEQSWCPQMASLSAIVRLWIPGFELFGRPATQRIAQYRARTVAISTLVNFLRLAPHPYAFSTRNNLLLAILAHKVLVFREVRWWFCYEGAENCMTLQLWTLISRCSFFLRWQIRGAT